MNLLKIFSNNRLSIPIILFIFSLSILSFNLEGQGIAIDEWFQHSHTMTMYDLLIQGKFSDNCITLLGECDTIDHINNCPGPIHRVATGGIARTLFIGLGDQFFSDNERKYYTSNELPCRPIHHDLVDRGINTPTQKELSAARFFVPIFSALSIIISFQIGKVLINKSVGLIFASVLLFHTLWFHFSRTLYYETFLGFFLLLTILLLIYSTHKNKINYKYFIFASIAFAFAINTKPTALELIPVILGIIFIHNAWNRQISWKLFHKKRIFYSLFLISIFFSISLLTLFSIFPYYWPDPIGQLSLQIDSLSSTPTVSLESNPLESLIPHVASVTIMPIIDSFYIIVSPNDLPESAEIGHTFSSLPLSLFFIIGIGTFFLRIKRKSITTTELVIFIWYVSTYVILSLLTATYNESRHFVPIIFTMILTMSYGLNIFFDGFTKKYIKKLFFSSVIVVHALTVLIHWELMYFKPDHIWILPENINLKLSFTDPIIISSSISFVIFFIYIIYSRKRYFQRKLE